MQGFDRNKTTNQIRSSDRAVQGGKSVRPAPAESLLQKINDEEDAAENNDQRNQIGPVAVAFHLILPVFGARYNFQGDPGNTDTSQRVNGMCDVMTVY